MDEKLLLVQDQLQYIYESAEERMEYNPDIAKFYQGVIRECPRYDTEEEAVEAYGIMRKEGPGIKYMVWGTIRKDEEFYSVTAPWVVTTGGDTQKAAEYVGMVYIEDYKSML